MIACLIVCLLCSSGCSGCPSSIQQETKAAKEASEKSLPPEQDPSSSATPHSVVKSTPDAPPSDSNKVESISPNQLPVANEAPSEATVETSGGSNAPSTTPRKSERTSGRASTPEKALAQARSLQRRAVTAKESRKLGQAFELASQAWEAVREFPDDAQCQQLARELESDLEEFGKAANVQSGVKAADSSKTLIEK